MSGAGLDAIAGSDGRFAVLAMDQRSDAGAPCSLAVDEPSEDADLSAFKVDIVRALAPLSSGVLLDADYGVGPVALRARCPRGSVCWSRPSRRQGSWNGEPRAARRSERGAEYVIPITATPEVPRAVAAQAGPAARASGIAAEALTVVGEVVADCRRAGIRA